MASSSLTAVISSHGNVWLAADMNQIGLQAASDQSVVEDEGASGWVGPILRFLNTSSALGASCVIWAPANFRRAKAHPSSRLPFLERWLAQGLSGRRSSRRGCQARLR